MTFRKTLLGYSQMSTKYIRIGKDILSINDIKNWLVKTSKTIVDDTTLINAAKNIEGTPLAMVPTMSVPDIQFLFGTFSWMAAPQYRAKYQGAWNLFTTILENRIWNR